MKVLVNSLSRDFGGVESLFLSLGKCDIHNDLQIDFVCTDSSAARENDFIALGSKVHHIERPSRNLRKYVKDFKHLFQTEKYDIYHVNLTRYRFPIDILIAKRYGAKIILHCHATQIYDVGSRKVRLVRGLEQALFKPVILACSNANLACSDNAGQYLFKGKKYKVIHNGIDLRCFRFDNIARNQVKDELGLKGKKVIGHIGRFSQEKNQSFLLKVMKELLKMCPEYRLLLIGDGDLFEKKKGEAKCLHIEHAVIFTGQRQDIPRLLSAMDLFAFPSIHEALPITLLEAQANGLPCIISDCVTKEIDVINTIRRLPLEIPVQDWAESIEEMCGKRIEIRNMGEFSDFEIRNMKEKLISIYKKLLEK